MKVSFDDLVKEMNEAMTKYTLADKKWQDAVAAQQVATNEKAHAHQRMVDARKAIDAYLKDAIPAA